MLTSSNALSESLSIEDFIHNIQQAQNRVEQLRGRAVKTSVQAYSKSEPSLETIDEACEELLVNLEQLRIAEAQLRQQNEELEASRTMLEYAQSRYMDLFESAPDAYLVTDIKGTIRECNQAAATLLGLSSKYASGKPLVAFVQSRHRPIIRTLINSFSHANISRSQDFEIVTRNTRVIPVTATICRTGIQTGNWGSLLWMIRDITTQVATKEYLCELNTELEHRVEARTQTLAQALHREHKANTAKVEFLASLSHEIRTPLHALMAYTDLLSQGLRGPVTDLQSKDLDRMRKGHEYILGLISRILDFARLENKQVTLQPVAVHVPTFIQGVMEMLQAQCVEHNIQYVAPSGVADLVVRADTEALRQILINLIGNAMKFNVPEGTVAISWTIEGNRAGIHVRDTGLGISEENLEFIFEPFVRVTAAEERHGTGLGLPISRALAEAMHGTLTVHSGLGKGSVFSLWLPVMPSSSTNSNIQ